MNIELLFDGGGTRDMEAYGSYRIITSGGDNKIQRVTFGTGYTNNEAEYMTLISGLEYILSAANKRGIASFDIDLTIKGDSELVRNQIGICTHIGAGFDPTEWEGWKVNVPHLIPLRDTARRLLLQFYSFNYIHIPRKEVVKVLGH
jgi:ribonuclease HI